MQHPKHLAIKDFSYHLPDERIAFEPLTQRDAAKLLVYQNGEINENKFHNLTEFLPAHSMIVFNQTKVVHARLLFYTKTNARIEIFCLAPAHRHTELNIALQQKGKVLWQCMIGRKAKWKNNEVLQLKLKDVVLHAQLMDEENGIVELSWTQPDLTFAEVLHAAGKVPLPPYIKRASNAVDEERYQTIFAKEEGSVAAPTASLHFTPDVIKRLADKNINTAYVTLHVGAGTFLPVKTEFMQHHDMHEEWIEFSAIFLQQLIEQQQELIVAAGTTALRTLESLYWMAVRIKEEGKIDVHEVAVTQWIPYERKSLLSRQEALEILLQYMQQNNLEVMRTRTQILIAPGYQLKMADAIITNFHQPGSTLLLLVAAVVGHDWQKIYDYAMTHQFRFLSYGDSSLLWANDQP